MDVCAQLFGQFADGDLALQLVFQRLLEVERGAGFFFQRAADLDGAAVAKDALDLAQNHRDRIGGKGKAPAFVKVFCRLDQADAARLEQVVILCAARTEPVGAGVHQPQILPDKVGL